MRLVLTLFSVIISFISFAQQSKSEYTEGEIYIKVKETSVRRFIKRSPITNVAFELPTVNKILKDNNRNVEKATAPYFKSKEPNIRNLYRIKLEGDSLGNILELFKNDPSIEYAEPVYLRQIISTPNDPQYASQWFIQKVKANDAWDVNPGIQDIVVAVVDNAIDTNHEDLAANMLPGRDVADNDNNPNPPNALFDHGTHVAGIVGAVNNNNIGIASSSNNRVKILPVKATSDLSNNRFIDAGFEGVTWAVDNGADIVSLSWGGGGYLQAEQDIIDYAYSQGVVVIAAAGNDNTSTNSYPAAYNHVISVAALDDTDEKSSFSSYGGSVDISAPGRGILSTTPFNTYASFNGTSMATPLVSSCAAYLLACFPTLSVDSVESILKITADDISNLNPSFNDQLGAGRVNLLKAVSCKDNGLFDVSVSATPSSYFCDGDSVLLNIPVVGTESFEWFRDLSSVASTNSFFAKEGGRYTLKRVLNDCDLVTDPFPVLINTSITSLPQSPNLYKDYCESFNLVAIAADDTDRFGPKSYIYGGPAVGFDGFLISGALPTVEVSDIGGLIDSVAISVTWEKKDGGNHLSCGTPSGSGTPFNEEVFLQLRSPEGKIINLVEANTYGRGTAPSGSVTTVFSLNGQVINQGDLPASGSFLPAGDLSVLEDDVPVGTWTLFAQDDATLDPLCVTGFSILVKTKPPISPATFSWFTGSSLASTTNNLAITSDWVGDSTFYVQSSVEGLCPSELLPVRVNVEPIPRLYAYPQNEVLITEAQAMQVESAISYALELDANNRFHVVGIDASSQAFDYLVSNKAPRKAPLSICSGGNYVIFADGCNGTITWSTGVTAPAIYLEGIHVDTTILATCNQTWTCTPLTNIAFDIQESSDFLQINGTIGANASQNYFGLPISSKQRILEASTIDYRSQGSILLQPGFETVGEVTFKAEIGGCQEP